MSTQNPSAAARPSCAACKYQRRRCPPDCLLAPYFPAHKQREFRNVHRLFGISNVVKLLKKVPPYFHDDAVASLVYEANFRAANPAGGACAVVQELRRRIDLCDAELRLVSQNLAFHRSRSRNDQETDFRVQEMDNFLNDKPSFPED